MSVVVEVGLGGIHGGLNRSPTSTTSVATYGTRVQGSRVTGLTGLSSQPAKARRSTVGSNRATTEIRSRLAEQVTSPVRFGDMIEAMYADGVRTFVEVGAGAVLTGMTGRILAGREHTAVPLDRGARVHGVTALHQALGQLAVRGVPLNLASLWEHHAPVPAPADSPKPGTVTRISGGNHGRRYPPPVDTSDHSSSSEVDLAAAGENDPLAAVLPVIAELTGYPVEVIGADMDIETDLGIDSIKRVEILSALRDRLPELATVSPEQAMELVRIRTVRELAERLGVLAAVTTNGTGTRPPRQVETTAEALTRLVVTVVPATPPGLPMRGIGVYPVFVTDDGDGIATLVCDELAGRGVPASVVTSLPADARAVICLDGLRPAETVVDAMTAQRAAFRAARTVAEGLERDGGVFVTVQDTGGDFGLRGAEPDRAWLGGLAALARTAAVEWPEASVKAIDCERAGRNDRDVAGAIVAELFEGGNDLNVGLRADGTRTTLADVDAPAGPRGETVLGEHSVLVVSGGARGVTAAAVRVLAERHRPRLVLLGRTELAAEPPEVVAATDETALLKLFTRSGTAPVAAKKEAAAVLAAREVRDTLRELAGTGAAVRYIALDVTDRMAVTRALDDVRREWGPITGVVHGAGVIADKRIHGKRDADFDLVFDTKTGGLLALLSATAADPLRLLCAFSSVTARYGNIGQADYAMANETVNQVLAAEAAKRQDCVVRSLCWGPWDGGMVSGGLARLLRTDGVRLIDKTDGGRAFVEELVAGPATVLLTAGTRVTEHVLDPVTDTWLTDHCPTWTTPVLPMMSTVDMMAGAAAALTGRDVTELSDVRLERWLPVHGRTSVRTRARHRGNEVEVALDVSLSGYERVASGQVSFTPPEHSPAPFPALADAADVDDPYLSGAQFHGPAFACLTSLRIGSTGATGVLDAARGRVPRGHLHQGLLDGMLHLLVPEGVSRWAGDAARDRICFPNRIVFLRMYGRLPDSGELLADVRFTGFDGERFPVFDCQLRHRDQVVVACRVVGVFLRNDRFARVTPARRRAFLRDREYVEGLGVSRAEGEETVLTPADLVLMDWMPGTVAAVYGLPAGARPADHLTTIAVKDHVARRTRVHPGLIEVAGDRSTAWPSGARDGVHRVVLGEHGDRIVVKDA